MKQCLEKKITLSLKGEIYSHGVGHFLSQIPTLTVYTTIAKNVLQSIEPYTLLVPEI